MDHESGFQNATLSPPKYICGFSSVKMVTKLMFRPTASGTKPSMVAVAVRITGVIRVLPPSIIARRVGNPSFFFVSINSTMRIPFRTTIPPKATTPNPVHQNYDVHIENNHPKQNSNDTEDYLTQNDQRFGH